MKVEADENVLVCIQQQMITSTFLRVLLLREVRLVHVIEPLQLDIFHV